MGRAFVTGASEGIGRAFCLRLAAEGWQVLGLGRNPARLKSLLMEMGGKGRGHQVLAADLSTAAGLAKAQAALRRLRPELLINNAGFGHYQDFKTAPWPKLESMLATNITALTRLSHCFLGQAKKGDALLNVSSNLAFLPYPAGAVYAASKAYVTSFSESLWQLERGRGVRVLNLCPGVTKSLFHRRASGHDRDFPAFMQQSAEQVVDRGLRALRRSGPTTVSGALNLALSTLARFLPRAWVVAFMGRTPV